MSGGGDNLTRSERTQQGPAIDGPTLMLTLAIVLLGLVMVTSASITIAGRDGDSGLAVPVGEVVFAYLTVIVREAVWVRFRFR